MKKAATVCLLSLLACQNSAREYSEVSGSIAGRIFKGPVQGAG